MQFLWIFKIPIICNVVHAFLQFRIATIFILVLRSSISNLNEKALYLIFCNLHILCYAPRYRENSHGMSKFKSFATYSMTFNLDNTCFFHITNRANSYGIYKFKPFATSSMIFGLHGPITFS